MSSSSVAWPLFGLRTGNVTAKVRGFLARPRGLRATLVVLVVAALGPPIVLEGTVALHSLRQLARAHAAALGAEADAAARVFDVKVARLADAARALSASDEGANGNSVDELARSIRVFAAMLETPFALWRTDGTLVDAAPPPTEPGEAPALQGVGVTSAPILAESPGAKLSLFVPLQDGGAGALILQLPLSGMRVQPPLSRAPLPGLAFAVVAADGTVLTPENSPLRARPSPFGAALAGLDRNQISRADVAGTPMVIAAAPMEQAPGMRMVAYTPTTTFDAVTREPLALTVAVGLLSVLMASAAAFAIGTRLTQPLGRLSTAAQAIAGGQDTMENTPRSAIREFNGLRESLLRAERVVRRRAAAERLATTEARTGHELLASVVNATADQIMVKDLDLRYVLTNRATLLLPFMKPDEWQVLGRRASDIGGFPEVETGEELDHEVLVTGEPRRQQFEWPQPDGSTSTFVVTKTPWRNTTGAIAGVVTVLHDITDTIRAEQRLAAVQGELLRASRLSAMGAMASGLAHELNQPLAAATNYLNAAARLLAREPPEPAMLELARGAVVDAAGQTLRAGSIVRRLREFVGRGEADLKPDDIADLTREACDVARTELAGPSTELVVRVPETPVAALADRTQIQQVLLNLIRNAGEAIGDAAGGRVEVSCDATREGVEIVVADNGPGLAPDVADRLFQPFVSTKALGMGIGLAICRTIVEGHGGTLTAGANPGGGARFRIVLPASPAAFPQSAQEFSIPC